MRHELAKGIICAGCKKVAYKPKYKAIKVLQPKAEDTTGLYKIFTSFNLCEDCYNRLSSVLPALFGRKVD